MPSTGLGGPPGLIGNTSDGGSFGFGVSRSRSGNIPGVAKSAGDGCAGVAGAGGGSDAVGLPGVSTGSCGVDPIVLGPRRFFGERLYLGRSVLAPDQSCPQYRRKRTPRPPDDGSRSNGGASDCASCGRRRVGAVAIANVPRVRRRV